MRGAKTIGPDIDNTEDRFEIVEWLGTGNFGHTYHVRVLDPALVAAYGTDDVVIKVPLNRQKELVLQKEVAMNAALHLLLKSLESSNLVRYLGVEVFRGQLVMVMEFVGGGTVRGLLGPIGQQRPLPLPAAIGIARGALRALALMHGERIFHRDIKPDNILMDGQTPKIADLGIARMLDPDEMARTTTGSLAWMAPETFDRRGASFPADVWSMGVTLYEMLVGRLPFGGPDTPLKEMIRLIEAGAYEPPCRAVAGLPPAMDGVVAGALNLDAGSRLTAAQMADALERAACGDERLEADLSAVRGLMQSVECAPILERRLAALLERYPDEPRCYQYLGELLNRCQRHEEAIGVFEQGLQRSPKEPLLHWDTALALHALGRRAQARKHLRTAVSSGLDRSLVRVAELLDKRLEDGE